jgi:hypothetical protein
VTDTLDKGKFFVPRELFDGIFRTQCFRFGLKLTASQQFYWPIGPGIPSTLSSIVHHNSLFDVFAISGVKCAIRTLHDVDIMTIFSLGLVHSVISDCALCFFNPGLNLMKNLTAKGAQGLEVGTKLCFMG